MGFNKKVLSKAVSELGKAKAPGKPKDIIVDPAGQWKYPGQKTRIPSSDITMQGVNYPVFAQPNVGPGTIMYPNQDYQFPGADYVDETPLVKKGGTLKSKKYSKSISATNKLFAKNKLFQNKKSKIFDPNAKFKSGGSKLGPINLNPNPLSHYELNYGFNLPVKQDGGVSSLEGDLISKVLMNRNRDKGFVDRAYALGANPGTPMFNVFEPDQFGQTMSHKMGWGTDDDGQAWMFPTVLNPDDEAIPVPNQYADYISSQGYKNATGMNEYQDGGESDYEELELTPEEIQAYRDGGYIVDELPEAQTGGTRKPLIISDPNKFAFRDRAYKDSLDMYKNDLLVTKYHNLTNNAQSMSDMAKYMKLEALATKNMENIKKNSPAKFGSVYAKQKKPVQPVVFKNGITNINTKSEKIIDGNGNEVSAERLKKNPPIYISDPKDVRIGRYSEAGNIYLYKPKPAVKVNTLKNKPQQERVPLKQSYEDVGTLPLRELQNFTMQEPVLQVNNSQLPLRQYRKSISSEPVKKQMTVPVQDSVQKTMRIPVQGVEEYWVKDPVLGNVKRQKPVTTYREVPWTDETPGNQNYNINTGTLQNNKNKAKRYDIPDSVKGITFADGGYVQHELVKAQTGLEQNDSDVYTYAGRPDSYYKKDDKGQWLISNKGTGNKFIPIKDPKGTRAKVLNEQAKKNVPMTDSPYALAASNFANNKGTDSKQAYIDKYQKSPELAKQKVVKQFKTDKELAKTAEFINRGKLENPTNTDQQLDPRLMGPVGDNTRTAAGFNGQQAFEGVLRYNSPESVEERKIQAEWEKQKWDEYAKKSLYDRVLDRTQAFAANPFVLTGNVLSGEQGFIPGMGRGLLNKDNPEEYDRYLQATGQVKGEVSLSDILNFVNPSHWGASAGNEFSKGNYAQGATELGLSLLGAGAGRGLLQGSKALTQSLGRGAKYVGNAMNTAPRFLPGATLNNALTAGFAGHGLYNIASGDVAEPWKKAMKTGNAWDYANALGENVMTALEVAPLVGPVAKGLTKVLNTGKESSLIPNRGSMYLEGSPNKLNPTENLNIVKPPSIPKKPLPSAETINKTYADLLIESGNSELTARARLADKYGRESLNVLDGTPTVVSHPQTGSINLRRNPQTNSARNEISRMLSEVDLNIDVPGYELPEASFDEFINMAIESTNNSERINELKGLLNNEQLRDRYEILRGHQALGTRPTVVVPNRNLDSEGSLILSDAERASLSNAGSAVSAQPAYARRAIRDFGQQNINTGQPTRYTLDDFINSDDVNINESLLTNLTKQSLSKKIGSKLSNVKNTFTNTLSDMNKGIGYIIDKSKIEGLKKPIKASAIETDVNKLLENGLGIKKGDVKIKVVTRPGTDDVQVLINPYKHFSKNKKLIESTYGKGTFDEWMKTMGENDWIDSGHLTLKPTFGEEVSPRTLTQILTGKKSKPSTKFGIGYNIELPAPGLKRSGDFPFENWDTQFREKILDNLGVSGELTQALKQASQNKGYQIYSGGTGHLYPGAKRYLRELLNDRVEIMNPEKADELNALLSDKNVLQKINEALLNKDLNLPSDVHHALQNLIFKYKRKGGEMDAWEDELDDEEIAMLKRAGYTIEEID